MTKKTKPPKAKKAAKPAKDPDVLDYKVLAKERVYLSMIKKNWQYARQSMSDERFEHFHNNYQPWTKQGDIRKLVHETLRKAYYRQR